MQPEFDAAIEPIYELPDEVIPVPFLRDLYRQTVQRLHMQAMSAGVNDYDLFMLIERTAFRYVVLRQKEMRLNGIGYTGNQEVALNKLWLDFYRELSVRLTPKNTSKDDFLVKVKQIIFDVVSAQEEPNVQRKLAEAFSSAFEREKI